MRPVLLFSLLLLASCSAGQSPSFSTKAPGLDVADAALANGAPETALHIAQRILATDSTNVPALIRAANAQAALGQREEAARTFNRVLAITPDKPEAALGLGRLKLATDAAAAAVLFQRVANRDPHNVAALIDFGIAKDLLGQHGDAQQAYRRALALEPDRLAANVNLGLSLALSGDPQQALGILRPLATGPQTMPRTRQDLAVALALAGDNDATTSVLQKDIAQPELSRTIAAYQMLRPKP